MAIFGTFVERYQISRCQFGNAVGIGLQVVQQVHVGDFELGRQLSGVNNPRKIRRANFAIANWPGDSKSSVLNRRRLADGRLSGNERRDDFIQSLMIRAAKFLGWRNGDKLAAVDFKER